MNLTTSEWQQIQGDARSLITDIEDIPLSEIFYMITYWYSSVFDQKSLIVFAVIFYELGQILCPSFLFWKDGYNM